MLTIFHAHFLVFAETVFAPMQIGCALWRDSEKHHFVIVEVVVARRFAVWNTALHHFDVLVDLIRLTIQIELDVVAILTNYC